MAVDDKLGLMTDIEPSLRVGRAITTAVDNLTEHSRQPLSATQVVAGMIDACHVVARQSGLSRNQYQSICNELWRLAETVPDKVVSGLMVLGARRHEAPTPPSLEDAEATVVDDETSASAGSPAPS